MTVPLRLRDVDYANPSLTFLVTIRAHPGRTPFHDPRVASEVVASLDWLRRNRGIRVHVYCVMPDHVHLLMRVGEDGKTLGEIIGAMKSFTTRRFWKLGYGGMLWQERFHDRVLREGEDPDAMATYILHNPVRKGLVTEPDDYQWSGTPDPM